MLKEQALITSDRADTNDNLRTVFFIELSTFLKTCYISDCFLHFYLLL